VIILTIRNCQYNCILYRVLKLIQILQFLVTELQQGLQIIILIKRGSVKDGSAGIIICLLYFNLFYFFLGFVWFYDWLVHYGDSVGESLLVQ
jgi:hypothetical protein